ncbi:MAG: YqiA/YcfP family alpha/beta fold hydrolase [Burkholderiaceae bacterium]
MPTTHLLYLHGFRSSPQSTKARQMAAWVALHRPDITWSCPQLAASPREALDDTLALVANWPRSTLAVMGSSLGGFYATVIAERLGCKAVLLNPAVNPARDLVGYVGDLKAWHSDEVLSFRTEFIDELAAMHPPRITLPRRYYAVIAKGDEVLDWREMTARYPGCRVELLEGSDHALSEFAEQLPAIAAWLDE